MLNSPSRPMRAVAWTSLGAVLCAATATRAGEPILFNRDIRPILSNQCFACHGPDGNQRQGGLRLDNAASAFRPADSGEVAIIAGHPGKSELVRRIFAEDPERVMPPPDSGKSLTDDQRELLRRWIAEGAPYEPHWAYLPPARASLPRVQNQGWPRNPIDLFVLARLERAGLQPSPAADPLRLFRRLALDLTGLPPEPEQVDTFLAEWAAGGGDDAYEKWVDRWLASPHFGERMAVDWLDAARFADTNGYQVDRDREMFAWRDWVIEAFNSGKPFDEFTIEQLAGDLLPGATLSQKIATGFHRNHMLNEEGGVIPEEFLVEYCADRVETTATVWLGQTFNCARCHDHKFDPFTQRDFYGLYAFFHSIAENGIGNYGASIRRNAPPILRLPAPGLEKKIADLQRDLSGVKRHLSAVETALAASQAAWEQRLRETAVDWRAVELTSSRLEHTELSLEPRPHELRLPELSPGRYPLVIEAAVTAHRVTAVQLQFRRPAEQPRADAAVAAPVTLGIGDWQLFQVGRGESPREPRKVAVRAADSERALPAQEVAKALAVKGRNPAQVPLNPEEARALTVEVEPDIAWDTSTRLRCELVLEVKTSMPACYLQLLATDADCDLLASAEIVGAVRRSDGERTADQRKALTTFRLTHTPAHRDLSERVAALNQQIEETEGQIPTALVMEELPTPRVTQILIRGAYDKKGDDVAAGTPAALPGMSAEWPRNRLGLARWLVDPANPLPARVTVNRLWQSFFGTGLVRTAEDFGAQGEPPTHPELLDWMALEFLRGGWDLKAMVRLIVTSATYRQASGLTPSLRDKDPENRLLARGPRFRLQAEFLRDQALAVSGLLVRRIGGPSVRPYHPPGLYEQVVAGSSANTYVVGKGEELYRRSLYTYWKRSVPHPAMLAFDAPFRETCTLRRPRTNTPLQALNLMNDPTYVEAARGIAEQMMRRAGGSVADQLHYGFRLVLARSPTARELAVLAATLERTLREYRDDPAAAAELLGVGDSAADKQLDAVQLAALTTVASVLLNLDETVTKE